MSRPVQSMRAGLLAILAGLPAAVRAGLSEAVLTGLVAAGLAGATMFALRFTLQVRTVPERVMEWLLLFVPLNVFEAGLQRWGFAAKWYGLLGAVAATFVLLAALGAALTRARASVATIWASALGLWLFTMLVVMPATGAGIFAVDLPVGGEAAVLGHLAAALAYAAVLVGARGLIHDPAAAGEPAAAARPPRAPSRRAALATAGTAALALGTTFLLDSRWSRLLVVNRMLLDPQEPIPSGGVDPLQQHPQPPGGAETPPPVATPTAIEQRQVSQPATAVAAVADASVVPRPVGPTPIGPDRATPTARPAPTATPAPKRTLSRDKDGLVLTSARRRGELSPAITDTDAFYLVSKNAVSDPTIRVDEWRLLVDGEVSRAINFDYPSLRNLPAVEIAKTLECISNLVTKCELAPFGCDLISTARWRGARLSDVLALAGGLKPGVASVAVISADEFTTSLPVEVALAPDTLLVYEMNGRPLAPEHGYPARLLVPGRYGMKSAKWVVALRAMRREFVDWYGQRDWSREAIVKTMTRIDTPAPGAVLPPGQLRVSGIAYAGDRGVSRVELSADAAKTWQDAEPIEAPPGRDTWVRWQCVVTLAPGAKLTLVARATDGTGALQAEAFSLAQPDGSAGWHATEIRTEGA